MAIMIDYGVGTGCSDGYITGEKSSFAHDEKVWACHRWDNITNGTILSIQYFRKVGTNWIEEARMNHLCNLGDGWYWQSSWIQNYTPGEWRVWFGRNDIVGHVKYFTLEEPPEPDWQYYNVSGTPLGAEIWDGGNFIGTSGMSFRLSWTNRYLTFKKAGYEDKTIYVQKNSDGSTINITYSLTQLLPTIKEMIRWQANVPDHGVVTHPFYLFSIYGINTNNTLAGFQVEKGTYARVITPTTIMPRQNDLTVSNVSNDDCLTIIAEYYNPSTGQISGIYDAEIKNGVI